MYKIMWLLRRKPGISLEQFRHHYETTHSVLGQKYLGHLIESYVRNYDLANAEGAEPAARTSGFDCITEWVLPDEGAMDEIMRILHDPVIGKLFHEDEEHFLDRNSVTLVRCDSRDTGSGDGAETLRLSAKQT